jgi:3-oxoacyl-[acyl-carrier protein] reductase
MGVLDGKSAVVTGGSRGIGRAIVERLAGAGAAVVFNYARSSDAAAAVERLVREAGGRAHAVQLDLAASGAVGRLMAEASEHLDGLDILVNNAALDAPAGPIADTDEQLWDLTMTVNARSAFLTTRHAARAMRRDGRIINISTMNTARPAPGIAAYAASKGAIEQLTKVAAIELGARGTTVNAICPGTTDTDLLRHANPEAALAQIATRTPLGRLGRPDDIAAASSCLPAPRATGLPVRSSTQPAASPKPPARTRRSAPLPVPSPPCSAHWA